MSYGHADGLAGQAHVPAVDMPDRTSPLDPTWYAQPEARALLDARDIGALYRWLKEQGITQRQIAELTGQAQSEVSEILRGRQVRDVLVLERITDGLGVPRVFMRLAGAPDTAEDAYGGEGTVAEQPEGVDEMRRRALLAAAGVAVVGQPIEHLGEILELPGPASVPLPDRIVEVHVAQVRDLTRRLGEAARAYGSDPAVSSAAAAQATRLLAIPGIEPVQRALLAAVAALHLHAGFAAFDANLRDRTLYHYHRGLDLATEARDACLQADALSRAGLAIDEYGQPNEGLKLLQLGQVKAWDIPPDHDRRHAVEACALADSATALGRLGRLDEARGALAKSRDRWQPTRTDTWGDLDQVAARLELGQGRLDVAEPFIVASLRRWEGISRRARTRSAIVLATIHVRAGEPGGLQLAHDAITAVTKLSSRRARLRLAPLAAALESRPGSDARDLARTARQVAATRA